MPSRSQSILSFSVLTTTLLGVALVLVNVVLARASTRIDLTEARLFRITDGTQQMLSDMRDPAEIRVFWGGLQARHEPIRRTFAMLLEEMANASNDKLTVRWVDVSKDEGKKEAEEAKVQKFLFSTEQGDEVVQSEGYSS